MFYDECFVCISFLFHDAMFHAVVFLDLITDKFNYFIKISFKRVCAVIL